VSPGAPQITSMNFSICIAGWSFKKDIYKLCSPYNTYVVCHRPGNTYGLPSTVITNVGLEFHKYDFYLKNIWDGESGVFFFQDDMSFDGDPNEIQNMYDLLTNKNHPKHMTRMDQVFIHGNTERKFLVGNGRAFFCTKKVLTNLLKPRYFGDRSYDDKEYTGFWWDSNPDIKPGMTPECDYNTQEFIRSINRMLDDNTRRAHILMIGLNENADR